ncbi:MAG: ABC transporter substrate-binding protein [Desulfobaccales bacterium]
MRNWSQYPVRVILGLILFLGLSVVGYWTFFPDLPLVGIIKWTEEIKTFEESQQGVIEGLREEGYQDGLNIRLEVKNVQRQRDAAAVAARDFQKEGARLLITLGTVPTLIALKVTNIPLVYTTVAAPNVTGLSRPAPPERIRFTGTSMEVPLQEQLRFLFLARPALKRLGILFCTATPQAVALGEAAEKVSTKLGLVPIIRPVEDDQPDTLLKAVNDLLSQRPDALFIPTDPVLVRPKNLKIICSTTSKALIPVMVANGRSVAHGALMAYHCDFVEMGRQAGRQAARILNGVPMDQVPPESPNITRLTINLKTAQDMGLLLPRQLLSQAHQFYQ